ncbi:cyclic nucleotide-binding domain-containing protein [Sphingobacterium sp. DK4209]|uniref:Cyclic nucleotide-binding domain-containing protein n=1 Tax=Sphingobacterium zhuxiongii TaxID=2662364 RepID=A0A5Q0QBW5_9SPHI|nr:MULTISPECIES: Crp/Fnr family transcriptional regulator [unclassified Sphingobacterium]MVZ65268.1 cyclic nucleotide-binding domain-containing protein [Sphingobacterium sp. DK4209]QGA26361.1 cyclic nucleotide-binding domain-containing protein [Sphingobacterium sp. dk4302]
MLSNFKNHIGKHVAISDEQFEAIVPYFEVLDVKKKAHLQNPGQAHLYNYFVLDGCLRMYTLHEKGQELTCDFALESWWICDQKAYIGKQESNCAIQAVENSRILRISRDQELLLLQEQAFIQSYFLQVYQKAYAAAQFRNKLFKLHSKEEIFIQFNNNFPDFVQRVPQYLIASYLGLTPEYLSEIRKKMFS